MTSLVTVYPEIQRLSGGIFETIKKTLHHKSNFIFPRKNGWVGGKWSALSINYIECLTKFLSEFTEVLWFTYSLCEIILREILCYRTGLMTTIKLYMKYAVLQSLGYVVISLLTSSLSLPNSWSRKRVYYMMREVAVTLHFGYIFLCNEPFPQFSHA